MSSPHASLQAPRRPGSARRSDRPCPDEARHLVGDRLAQALRESRATTLARVMDKDDDAWRVPQRQGINPVAWELGHLAWFGEFWLLRGPHVLRRDGFIDAARPARISGPDAVFDSARLGHAARWHTPLPSRGSLIAMLGEQLEACVEAIPDAQDDASHYFHRLALLHEDMHGEAFAWLRATLSWPAPEGLEAMPASPGGDPVRVGGGLIRIGRPEAASGFSFDNEQPALTVGVAPFEIDASPVTAGRFACFVDAGGYDNPDLWPGVAGSWRTETPRSHPERWRRAEHGGWETRWFDRWAPLDPDTPVIHVNAWEAEAYCRWARRRLPSAAEWECAAPDRRFHWGQSVWEWTASPFDPYPGFRPGPYRDYSQPWFGNHRELRGGSFAAQARLHHPSYRNFFTPERSDVFAGFRTASNAS